MSNRIETHLQTRRGRASQLANRLRVNRKARGLSGESHANDGKRKRGVTVSDCMPG